MENLKKQTFKGGKNESVRYFIWKANIESGRL